jgi:hypothetical protein
VSSLLAPQLKMELLPFEDGRSAPKVKGSTWRREYAAALASGPYARTERFDDADEGASRFVDIAYKEGTRALSQRWKKVTPQNVRVQTPGAATASRRGRRSTPLGPTPLRRSSSTSC